MKMKVSQLRKAIRSVIQEVYVSEVQQEQMFLGKIKDIVERHVNDIAKELGKPDSKDQIRRQLEGVAKQARLTIRHTPLETAKWGGLHAAGREHEYGIPHLKAFVSEIAPIVKQYPYNGPRSEDVYPDRPLAGGGRYVGD